MKKGFTLIELLVVVLIIGILSAIALPQYERAVERSKAAELFTNVAALQRAIDIRIMENGQLSSSDAMTDIFDEVLSGGQMDGSYYKTKNFWYWGTTWTNGGEIFIFRGDPSSSNSKYQVYVVVSGSTWSLSGNFPSGYEYMHDYIYQGIRNSKIDF